MRVPTCLNVSIREYTLNKKKKMEDALSGIYFKILTFNTTSEEFFAYLTNCKHRFDNIKLKESWGEKVKQHFTSHDAILPIYACTHGYSIPSDAM